MHKSKDYHPGVIGLVAGRVCERYGRPAIICEERDGLIVGSCRSVPGWHVADALSKNAGLFQRFGGHSQAAGFTAGKDNYDEIVRVLLADARETLQDKDLRPRLELVATLSSSDMKLSTWKMLRDFEPYGVGNETPIFYLPESMISEVKPVGSTKAHLKMRIKVGSKNMGAIFFGGGEFISKLQVGQKVELAVTLEKHVWNGWADLELGVKDIKVKK